MAIEIVLPGDDLTDRILPDNLGGKAVLGPGLKKDANRIIACNSGLLKHRKPNVFWVDVHSKRYIPNKGETIIGTVIAKGAESLRVDIGSSEPAVLSLLAFESATKRNKPIIQVGDIVNAQILVGNKDTEPELVCVDRHGKKNRLGILENDGFVFNVPLHMVRKILSPQCPLLEATGKMFKYEIVVGMNGRIWIKAGSVTTTMLLYNAVMLCEYMSPQEVADMVSKLFKVVK